MVDQLKAAGAISVRKATVEAPEANHIRLRPDFEAFLCLASASCATTTAFGLGGNMKLRFSAARLALATALALEQRISDADGRATDPGGIQLTRSPLSS